jgi:HEPN domain-containing protein
MTNLNLTRYDFQKIARIRLREAKLLLDNKNYDGAYYLSGYAVECGLKACIARQTKKHAFPDLDTVKESYTHKLNQLLGIAGLTQPTKDDRTRNKNLEVNWSMVVKWNEESRYVAHNELDTNALYSAITDRKDGVMRWIRKYW